MVRMQVFKLQACVFWVNKCCINIRSIETCILLIFFSSLNPYIYFYPIHFFKWACCMTICAMELWDAWQIKFLSIHIFFYTSHMLSNVFTVTAILMVVRCQSHKISLPFFFPNLALLVISYIDSVLSSPIVWRN